MSPWNVARTTLWWVADPIDLVSTFWMPAKSIGSANHHNVVRATFQGLMELREPGNVLKLRGREPEPAETR